MPWEPLSCLNVCLDYLAFKQILTHQLLQLFKPNLFCCQTVLSIFCEPPLQLAELTGVYFSFFSLSQALAATLHLHRHSDMHSHSLSSAFFCAHSFWHCMKGHASSIYFFTKFLQWQPWWNAQTCCNLPTEEIWQVVHALASLCDLEQFQPWRCVCRNDSQQAETRLYRQWVVTRGVDIILTWPDAMPGPMDEQWPASHAMVVSLYSATPSASHSHTQWPMCWCFMS